MGVKMRCYSSHAPWLLHRQFREHRIEVAENFQFPGWNIDFIAVSVKKICIGIFFDFFDPGIEEQLSISRSFQGQRGFHQNNLTSEQGISSDSPLIYLKSDSVPKSWCARCMRLLYKVLFAIEISY